MAVLVTGGLGFLGRHLCKRLLDNEDVYCIDTARFMPNAMQYDKELREYGNTHGHLFQWLVHTDINIAIPKLPSKIADSDSSNSGVITAVNGTNNVTLRLPSTIKATLTGNADTATQFSTNTTVTLTGDATGTSAGSKKGWSVPVTLANTGVAAGTYGHNTSNTNIQTNTGSSITVPVISVDSKGRITYIRNNPCTVGLDTIYYGDTTFKAVVGGWFNSGNKRLYLSTRDIKINSHGRIYANNANYDISIDLSSLAGIAVSSTTNTFYSYTTFDNGAFAPGSALYSNYSKRGDGFNWYGQQNGTWIATGNAWHVDHVQWYTTSGYGSHSSSTSHSADVYAQNFRRLSV